MRSLPLLLLVLVAAGGLAWLFFAQDDEAPEPYDEPPPREELPTPKRNGDPPGPLKVDPVVVVGVVGRDPVPDGSHLDYGEIMDTKFRIPQDLEVVTGADLLAAIEAVAGDRMPIRFESEDALRLFRKSEFPREDATDVGEHHLHEVIHFAHTIGFAAVQEKRYLLLREMESGD